MKEIRVEKGEDGQRLDKFVKRKLSYAPSSFVYKMLRKKNITLNGKKAEGNEILSPGDRVTFFLSDETFDKFHLGTELSAPEGEGRDEADRKAVSDIISEGKKAGSLKVLYEDRDVLLVIKPAGILSQKAAPGDVSVNEWLLSYLLEKAEDPLFLYRSFREFRPSVCNRLDRNTGGILICAKSLTGSRVMTGLIRDRKIRKFYRMVVVGEMEQGGRIEGWISKDHALNKVTFSPERIPDADYSRTVYRPIRKGNGLTLVEAELITGRSHQLRVQFAHLGCPIAGDPKYGDREKMQDLMDRFHIRRQLLYCCRLEFPLLEGDCSALSGRKIEAPLPALYTRILK
jgi:23S rRNA pseudouridine955/2504/2580 synthase